LIHATSTGLVDFEDQFNEIIAMVENEEELQELIQGEYDQQLDDLDNIINPFQSWTEDIFIKSKFIYTGRYGVQCNVFTNFSF